MATRRTTGGRHHGLDHTKLNEPSHQIRLVALDLDGTTLNPSHELNQATIDAVRASSSQGIQFVLVSGRHPQSILPFARQLGLGGVHIGLNGGVSFDQHGKLRHSHPLTTEQLTLAIEVFTSEDLVPLVYNPAGLWIPRVTPEIEFLIQSGEPCDIYDPQNLAEIKNPLKVIAVLKSGPRDKLIASRVEPRLHAVRSGPEFLELMPPGVTKGAALTEYLADLGLAKEHVLAIGDSENDAALLAAAGFSVAMGNAVDDLKAQAHSVTETNVEDGVAQALRRWVLDQ